MLIRGDARHLPLQDGCIDCIITSPPYWNLREYPDPRQIGMEPTPDAYVANLVAVFREVWRVLKDDGTVWLNLGDSHITWFNAHVEGLKFKDLVGIPWAVAFALRADGWCLRADIIWSKPQCMPESVKDRPTQSHEYLFLLSKQASYYYDADAIAEPLAFSPHPPRNIASGRVGHTDGSIRDPQRVWGLNGTRNKRSVWTVNKESYRGAHFATMPKKLIVPCVLAGCRVGGFVLDPFVGSGTVVAVAERFGRRGIGLDLAYQSVAKERTAQRRLPL